MKTYRKTSTDRLQTLAQRHVWTICSVVVLGLLQPFAACSQAIAATVPLVVSPEAQPAERAAAQELARHLQQIYPQEQFALVGQLPDAGQCILVGNFRSDAKIKRYVANASVGPEEGFLIKTVIDNARQIGVIAGADTRGVIYGVYALLEKLGCGFYLSYDALPPPRQEAFSVEGWQMASAPLVRDRLVFDWHNFLSGCSTWNLEHWNSWTLQSQKMGYNAIMVHAYGNNPMVRFTFNGKTKPVGYLSTTARGRDWSTMHVNDVRRLWGGQVFDGPVFGAEAGMVAEDNRAESAEQLMRRVFQYAHERAMGVYFAVDVDTLSANPQELIETLPAEARFTVSNGKVWVPNPEMPEGYRYYKAQVEALLTAYPQITDLVVWFRSGATPWLDMKVAEMPSAWQDEYKAALAQTPEAAKYWHSHNMFAIGKIVRAFERALQETGHQRVHLCSGTWNFAFLAGCDLFMPRHVKLIGLDYGVLHDDSKLETAEKRQIIAQAGAHRPVIPVAWAQHDDGNYIGRSYTPFTDFYSKLSDAKACGFGVIHWTTRPLDLFFKSLSQQVWSATKDEPLRVTCNAMAERSFGKAAARPMGEYLEHWVTDAPKFARETSDHFIDRQLTDIAGVVEGCHARLKLIEQVDPAGLSPTQHDRIQYYQGLEEFIAAFYQCQDKFQQSQQLLKAGDLAAARAAMAQCHPQQVIEQFATFSSLGGMTRGEQGLVVSENLRWLAHYVHHRQSLGVEAIRYRFSPTSHDALAQSAGAFTFHFDTDRQVWQCFGEQESGAKAFVLPPNVKIARPATVPLVCEEICRTGIESDKPLVLAVQPIVARKSSKPVPLPPGEYQLHLLLLDPTSRSAGQRVFTVSVSAGPSAFDRYVFEPIRASYLRLACHGNSANDWNSIQEVRIDSLAARGSGLNVTASASVEKFSPNDAIDGDLNTRWAAYGKNHWIQFRLDPQQPTDSIDIAWYQADKRQARFEILLSDDGKRWAAVKNQQHAPTGASLVTDRVDIFQEAGQPNKIVERVYPIKLDRAAALEVTLTPEQGSALLSGLVLEPVAAAARGPK